MKVYSFWRCAGSAGVYLSVGTGKDTKMSETVTILYCGNPVSAPKEVADFLEQDRKREQAQTRQDTRHLSRSEFETVPSNRGSVRRPTEDEVLRNLQLENLQKAMKRLDPKNQGILDLRYSEDLSLSIKCFLAKRTPPESCGMENYGHIVTTYSGYSLMSKGLFLQPAIFATAKI